MAPGRHRVIADDGGLRRELEISVEAGSARDVEVELLPTETAIPSAAVPQPAAPISAPAPPRQGTGMTGPEATVLGALVGLGVGGVVMGIGGLTQANDYSNDADRTRAELSAANGSQPADDICAASQHASSATCALIEGRDDRTSTMTALSVTGFVVAGLAAAGATVFGLHLLARSNARVESAHVVVTPVIARGSGGAVLVGSF